MSRRKPSYFDDDYDERIQKRRNFTFKSFLQILAYFIIVAFKWLRDTAISIYQRRPITKAIQSSRKRKRLNFILVIVSILIFALMINTVILAVNNENKKIAKFNADAGAVCAEYMKKYGTVNYENMYSRYGIAGYRMTGLCYARELDFDNDGTSELLLCYDDSGVYQAEVWGYRKNKFVNLYHGKACQTKKKSDDVWVTLYYHNNKHYIGAHSEKDKSVVSLFGLSGDEFVKKYDASYDEQAEVFLIRKKVDYTSFERIKLSVLREEKASVILDTVSNTIDGFKTDKTNTSADADGVMTREKAYAEVVANYQESKGAPSVKTEGNTAYIDGLSLVRLVDFDGDGKNELLISYRKASKIRDEDNEGNYISVTEYKYQTEIYAYKNKKAKLIFQKDDASQKPNGSQDKYVVIQSEGDKRNLCVNSYTSKENDHVKTATSTIFVYDGKTFEPSFKAKYVTDYGYTEYYIDDKQVWSRQFDEEGYVVPFFDGSSSYSATNFDICYLQRSDGDKASLQEQCNETIKTIEKLAR